MVLFIDEPVKLVEDKRFPEDVYGDGYAFLRQTILRKGVAYFAGDDSARSVCLRSTRRFRPDSSSNRAGIVAAC